MKDDRPKGHDAVDSNTHPDSSDHYSTNDHHGRFATREEFRTKFGREMANMVATERAIMGRDRHIMRQMRFRSLQPDFQGGLLSLPGNLQTELIRPLRPPLGSISIGDLSIVIGLPRVDHRTLTDEERSRFNTAVQKAHTSTQYQLLADIHLERKHRMHGIHAGVAGNLRFLPWHRQYMLEFEKMLRLHEPTVRIPYWDYANDRARPDWVYQPSSVSRGQPGANGDELPDPQVVSDIIQNSATYSEFAEDLEYDAHNSVHNWCNGTISNPDTATQDPIFWLLHANVDRLWDRWQITHDGVPLLTGTDAVLDPWQPVTVADVDSISQLGYWYGLHTVGPWTS
ncbi:tyrosinase family protein [Mesorhizobium sp.]|uniref:tyrosinase family protein n=1 Tax=Mesorhizobium sp. TaxID=1871066 RepID=UPI00257C67DF|nr:tyrosinase family protein [Mesorhizobium sp.]